MTGVTVDFQPKSLDGPRWPRYSQPMAALTTTTTETTLRYVITCTDTTGTFCPEVILPAGTTLESAKRSAAAARDIAGAPGVRLVQRPVTAQVTKYISDDHADQAAHIREKAER